MKTKKRQKLCYNCEGEIDLDVIVCPFCAADLREEKPEREGSNFDPSVSLKNLTTHQSLYPPRHVRKEEEEKEAPLETSSLIEEDEEEQKGSILPTVLLTLGAQLFLLSCFMLLFSHHQQLTLKWDARYWFLYMLASIPLFLFGYRSLK